MSLPKDPSMLALYQRLAEDIAGWRTRGYPTEAYPALADDAAAPADQVACAHRFVTDGS